MSQGEGFLFPFLHHHTSLLKGVVGLSFTACIDEQSFIMRIVRAQEIIQAPFLPLLREHRTKVGVLPIPAVLFT